MGALVATTYSIPRWRYVSRGGVEEPERRLFRQARNPDLGSRGEILDGDWRALRADEHLAPVPRAMPQVDNEWVR